MFDRRSFESLVEIGLTAGMLNYVIRESLMKSGSISIGVTARKGLDKILNLRQSIRRKLLELLNKFRPLHWQKYSIRASEVRDISRTIPALKPWVTYPAATCFSAPQSFRCIH